MLGSLAAGVLASVFARRFGAPPAVFAFPAVVAFVLGSYAFRAAIGSIAIANGTVDPALIGDTLSLVLNTVLMVAAIAVGVAAPALLLPSVVGSEPAPSAVSRCRVADKFRSSSLSDDSLLQIPERSGSKPQCHPKLILALLIYTYTTASLVAAIRAGELSRHRWSPSIRRTKQWQASRGYQLSGFALPHAPRRQPPAWAMSLANILPEVRTLLGN